MSSMSIIRLLRRVSASIVTVYGLLTFIDKRIDDIGMREKQYEAKGRVSLNHSRKPLTQRMQPSRIDPELIHLGE